MGAFAVGGVVLVAFPYANFTKFKKRPALIVGKAEHNNLILCQITSNANASKLAIAICDSDFSKGSLHLDSFVRPYKLFTVELSVVEGALGVLKAGKLDDIKSQIQNIFI